MHQEHKILSFLNHDILRHIVHLKMLRAYPGAIQCFYHEADASVGVLMLLETSASPFDAQTYPSTRYVVLPTVTGEQAAHVLLAYVPSDCDLVFKLIDEWAAAAVIDRFHPARQTAFLSYTSRARRFSRAPEVRISGQPDDLCLPLFAANGYSAEEMRTYFERGAFSLTVYDVGEWRSPVAAGFCFPNFEPVWEIAGLRTVEGHRRKGYARKVVRTALAELRDRGAIARYQVRDDNRPSIRLAEAVGLERFLVTEHFLYKAPSVNSQTSEVTYGGKRDA
jgi:ribosomal protein S18 acetylase RimI-like enzyme